MAKIKHVEIRIFTEVLSIVYGPREVLPYGQDSGISEWAILDALWTEREKSRYPEYVFAYAIFDDGTEFPYLEFYSSRSHYLKEHAFEEIVRPMWATHDHKRNIYAFARSGK